MDGRHLWSLVAPLLLLVAPGAGRAAQPAPGFPKRITAPVTTPLALAGTEPDGSPRLVFGAGNELHCLTGGGRVCDGFPVPLGEKVVAVGAPAAADLDGDSRLELAVALSDGRLIVLGADGSPLPGFAFSTSSRFEAGPALLDVDGDGRLEVVVGTRDGRLHALDLLGEPRPGFPRVRAGAVTSTASAALFGAPARVMVASGNEDGKLYVEDAAGRPMAGTPFPSQYLISGQPAIGDLDGDGWADVAFASQDFKLYALHHDGRAFEGFPVPTGARLVTGPALADLDRDGRLELVVSASDGRVHAVDWRGVAVKGFPARIGERAIGAATVADLDRDGTEEILAASADGQLHVLRVNGRPFSGFPARLGSEPVGGPLVAPLGDSTLVAIASADAIVAFRVRRAGKSSAPFAWPESGHDSARTGRLHPNPPGYADLVLSPAVPTTESVLSASYRFHDLDGDPAPATAVRWLRDGAPVAELDGALQVPSRLTKKGQAWRFQVSGEGAVTQRSAEVTVANTPPGRPVIALEPATARRAEALTVNVVEDAADPDHDRLRYRYAWLRDGQPQRELTEPVLPPGTLKKGERWTVVVTASDGEADGPPASLETVVQDSAPGAPRIALSPARPRAGDVVAAVIETPASDVDGDVLRYRYRFFLDGAPLSLASTVAQAPAFTARRGQTLSVEVRADDGELLGPAASAKALVVNTAPTAPVPAIAPANPRRGDTLVAGLSVPSTDVDGDALVYRFAFRRAGEPIAPAGSREVSGIRKGDRYELEVVASDGVVGSPPARVAVTVANTPPTSPVLAFASLPLRRVDPVEVRIVEEATDADGDRVSYAYEWARDGAPQPGLTGPRLPAGTVGKGERWTVTVIPSDGQETGRPARLEAVVVDSAPTAPELALTPPTPRAGDAIRAVIQRPARDPDGDPVRFRYRFLVDGVPVALDSGVDTLPAGRARKHQVVEVQVQADDGELLGPRVTARTTVRNSPPGAPKVLLFPAEPRRGDLLQAGLAAGSEDPDGDRLVYRFAFTRDGVAVPGEGREVGGLRKGERYVLQVIASDGEADSPPASASVVVRNSLPTAPAISFADEAPQAGEPVALRIDRASEDPDGDTISYALAYSVNGAPSGLPADARAIPAGRLRKHEVWTVVATPFDGEQHGPAGHARLVVANTAPTAPRVAIDPAEPTAGSGARARIVVAASDHDTDPVSYRYAWYVNGVRLQIARDAAALPPGALTRGDRIRLVVTAWDGEVEGPVAEAAALVRDSGPSAPEIALAPPTPRAGDALRCEVRTPARDPDRETPRLTYAWRRDGELQPLLDGQERVPAGVARRGETWNCTVTATDGELSSAAVSARVTVANTPPTAPVAGVEPDEPRAGQDLSCRILEPSSDADADPISYAFRWTRDGKPVAVNPKTPWILPAAAGGKGAGYRCEVTPSDGALSGPVATVEGRYHNTPPSGVRVRLVPEAPRPAEALRCEIVEPASDPDGDVLSYRFTWLKNGVELRWPETAAEIPAKDVSAGDIWRCLAAPFDGESRGERSASAEVIVQPPASSVVR